MTGSTGSELSLTSSTPDCMLIRAILPIASPCLIKPCNAPAEPQQAIILKRRSAFNRPSILAW